MQVQAVLSHATRFALWLTLLCLAPLPSSPAYAQLGNVLTAGRAALPAPSSAAPPAQATAAPASAENVPEATMEAVQRAIDDPLTPVPEASPRQTFLSFRLLTIHAEQELLQALKLSKTDDAIFDTPQITALRQDAVDSLVKASALLDLSAVPPANRRAAGINAVLMLNEILDRIPLPSTADIPGASAVEAGKLPHGWTIPDTALLIAPVKGADGRTCFLFAQQTVSDLPYFYDLVQDMPARRDTHLDFYQSFVLGPGFSMPMMFYRYVLNLPSWMLVAYKQQAVWQWMALFVSTVFFLGLIALLIRWDGRRRGVTRPVARAVLRLITPLAIALLLGVYLWFDKALINLTGNVLATLELAIVALQALALAAAALAACNAAAAMIIATPHIKQESLDASLIRLAFRAIGIIAAAAVLSMAATHLGVPLYGVVASVGIGGLALALAIQPTLENFIGSIILYADRPVKVGDFCRFGDMLGTVEAIGLRSTKVRALDRTLVTVQNSEFAQMSLTNFTRRDANLMQSTIGLSYETPIKTVTTVIEGIATMLREDERVDAKTVRVCLRNFGAYAIEIEIWAYILCPDWAPFLKIQEDLYMKVMVVVQDAGTHFAIPAQTTYLDHRFPASLKSPAAER